MVKNLVVNNVLVSTKAFRIELMKNPLWKNEDLGHVVLLSNVGYISPVSLDYEKASAYFKVYNKDGDEITCVFMNARVYREENLTRYTRFIDDGGIPLLMEHFDETVSAWHYGLESAWVQWLNDV